MLSVFDPIRAEMAKISEHNATLTFDYETADGNKAARSHIFKLRQVKTRISDAHKTAKAQALEVCQMLDSKKRELTADVDSMIEVHD
jgi:hypothetical protein